MTAVDASRAPTPMNAIVGMAHILCTQALEHAMVDLTPGLETATGLGINLQFGTTGGLVNLFVAGNPAPV